VPGARPPHNHSAIFWECTKPLFVYPQTKERTGELVAREKLVGELGEEIELPGRYFQQRSDPSRARDGVRGKAERPGRSFITCKR
jgi:hypothetical protein